MIGVVEAELMSIVDELLSSGCGGRQRMHLHQKFGAVDLRQVLVRVPLCMRPLIHSPGIPELDILVHVQIFSSMRH